MAPAVVPHKDVVRVGDRRRALLGAQALLGELHRLEVRVSEDRPRRLHDVDDEAQAVPRHEGGRERVQRVLLEPELVLPHADEVIVLRLGHLGLVLRVHRAVERLRQLEGAQVAEVNFRVLVHVLGDEGASWVRRPVGRGPPRAAAAGAAAATAAADAAQRDGEDDEPPPKRARVPSRKRPRGPAAVAPPCLLPPPAVPGATTAATTAAAAVAAAAAAAAAVAAAAVEEEDEDPVP